MSEDQDDLPWSTAPVKTYRGFPGPPDMRVTVDDDSGSRFLEPSNPAIGFDWGKTANPAACRELSKAILRDLLGDEQQVTALYTRVEHRTVRLWTAGQPWSITSSQLHSIIEQVRKVEQETAHLRSLPPLPPPGSMGMGADLTTVGISPQDQGPKDTLGPAPRAPAPRSDQLAALAKLAPLLATLTPEEKKALGL